MPKRSSKRPKTEDVNQAAYRIVAEAAGDTSEPKPEKDPLAVELGRRGGLKGGRARAASLTPEQRREIAKTAAKKRWAPKDPENNPD